LKFGEKQKTERFYQKPSDFFVYQIVFSVFDSVFYRFILSWVFEQQWRTLPKGTMPRHKCQSWPRMIGVGKSDAAPFQHVNDGRFCEMAVVSSTALLQRPHRSQTRGSRGTNAAFNVSIFRL
jgi:hypothetical protein